MPFAKTEKWLHPRNRKGVRRAKLHDGEGGDERLSYVASRQLGCQESSAGWYMGDRRASRRSGPSATSTDRQARTLASHVRRDALSVIVIADRLSEQPTARDKH